MIYAILELKRVKKRPTGFDSSFVRKLQGMTENNKLKVWEKEIVLLAEEVKRDIDSNAVNRAPEIVKGLLEVMNRWKKEFVSDSFSTQEEIYFFKQVKPKLTALLLYAQEIYQLEANVPLSSNKKKKLYYKKKGKFYRNFFAENDFFYRYHLKELCFLDPLYFMRNQNETVEAFDILDLRADPLFSTSHDFKKAQMLAYKDVYQYIQSKIIPPEGSSKCSVSWKASKTGLIELIYALHSFGAIGTSKGTLQELIASFENYFGIELQQYHRVYIDIKARKIERTKFLNALAVTLIHKMEAEEEK